MVAGSYSCPAALPENRMARKQDFPPRVPSSRKQGTLLLALACAAVAAAVRVGDSLF